MKKILVLIWVGALLLGLLIYGMVDTPRPETQAPTASEDGGTEDVPTTPVAKTQLRIRAPREWDAVISDYAAVSGVQLQRVDDLSGDPELILVDSALEVAQWSDRCADLSATAAYAQLVSWDLAVKVDGNVCAIPLQMEGHGLVCDTKLLASAYSLSDIRDFETLRDSVAHITDAGMTAFAPTTAEKLAALVASLPGDSRGFVDLYLSHGGAIYAGPEKVPSPGAVFYLGSTAGLEGMEDISLGILPLCLGHETVADHTLCISGSSYLCVRSDITEERSDAAMAFLSYLVAPAPEGKVPLDTMGYLSPFRQAVFASNGMEQTLRNDLSAGKGCLRYVGPQSLPEGMAQALLAYAEDPTDEAWARFEALIR